MCAACQDFTLGLQRIVSLFPCLSLLLPGLCLRTQFPWRPGCTSSTMAMAKQHVWKNKQPPPSRPIRSEPNQIETMMSRHDISCYSINTPPYAHYLGPHTSPKGGFLIPLFQKQCHSNLILWVMYNFHFRFHLLWCLLLTICLQCCLVTFFSSV